MTESRRALTGWVDFQVELSNQFLRQAGARLFHAAPILLLAMGPLFIGLIAFIALAPMMAPGFEPPQLVALVFGQAIVLAMPLFLARKLVLPNSVVRWGAGLPITWQTKFFGNASAALVLLLPIFAACLASAMVWFWQWPQWLRPVWGTSVVCLLASMFGAWCLGTLVLTMRAQSLSKFTYPAKSYTRLPLGKIATRGAANWRIRHDLILKAVWRSDSLLWRVGHPLLILCAGVCVLVICLMDPEKVPWRGAYALLLSTLIVGLTLWRDAQIRNILAGLKVETAALPLSFSDLVVFARFWAAGSAGAIAALFLVSHLSRLPFSMAGASYFAVSFVGAYAMLSLSKAATPGRASFAVCLWALLAIIGHSL